MSDSYKEADYENTIIELFQNMGYQHVYGPNVERDYKDSLYETELEDSIRRINPDMPGNAIQEALFKLRNFENADLVQKNALFMSYIQNGIEVRYLQNGEERSDLVYLVDYKNPDNNSFVIANQWTFIENSEKRPDVLLFLNGMPIVLMELKSPSREETDASEAYRQIRNYMHEIPSMFIYNCICVISDPERDEIDAARLQQRRQELFCMRPILQHDMLALGHVAADGERRCNIAAELRFLSCNHRTVAVKVACVRLVIVKASADAVEDGRNF